MQPGRFVCVTLPILLTIGAIVAFMIATLSGVAHNSLYMFSVDLENLSIDPEGLSGLVGDLNIPGLDNLDDLGSREVSEITAADLTLGKAYDITLWGYCTVEQNDKRVCTKAEFDWAAKHIKTDFIDNLTRLINSDFKLPDEIKGALDIFTTVTKYTEIAFIVALAVLGLELFVGIFSNCTRIISCLTWLIGIAAIVLCVAAAGLATAMSAVVVGALEATAKEYGVRGSINTQFLITIWIGAAFAVAASLFWLFTICCCKPERRSGGMRTKHRDSDSEKLMPTGAYAPIGNDTEMTSGNTYSNAQNNQFQPSYGHDYSHAPSYHSGQDNSRSDLAYEPYTHRA